MEFENLLPSSQEPAAGLYPQLNKSHPHPPILSVRPIFILCYYRHQGLPGGLFRSSFLRQVFSALCKTQAKARLFSELFKTPWKPQLFIVPVIQSRNLTSFSNIKCSFLWKSSVTSLTFLNCPEALITRSQAVVSSCSYSLHVLFTATCIPHLFSGRRRPTRYSS
jgi:hypothetical protein